MQPPRLVAVDSNILFALAEEDEDTLDAWELIRTRLRPAMMFVPPTVLDEIAHKACSPQHDELHRLAVKILAELRPRWMLQPVELRSDQETVVHASAQRIRDAGLLPYAERNDAYIVAETAVLESTLLVSNDSHLGDMDRRKLKQVLRDFDLRPPVIATPRQIVRTLGR